MLQVHPHPFPGHLFRSRWRQLRTHLYVVVHPLPEGSPATSLSPRPVGTQSYAAAADHALGDDRLVVDRADRGRGDHPAAARRTFAAEQLRSEEHTSELQSLMHISYAVFCLKKKKK